MPDDPPQRRTRASKRQTPLAVSVMIATHGVRAPLASSRVRALTELVLERERVAMASIFVQFVSARRIAALNKKHLGHGGATDIVTLEHRREVPGAPVVGEIHISPEVAARNAAALGIAARDEVARLVVHGALHALGWEHPEGQGRIKSPMWQRQESHLRAARKAGVI